MGRAALINPSKRVLLVDLEDTRRQTRVRMLTQAGHDVQLRVNHVDAEWLDHEGHFDLVILSLHRTKLEEAASYSERLRIRKPDLPVLLLLDVGVFVPRGTLSPSIDTGYPVEFMREVASMLAGSTHIREVDPDGSIFIPTDYPGSPGRKRPALGRDWHLRLLFVYLYRDLRAEYPMRFTSHRRFPKLVACNRDEP